jgi:hypothetical protein
MAPEKDRSRRSAKPGISKNNASGINNMREINGGEEVLDQFLAELAFHKRSSRNLTGESVPYSQVENALHKWHRQ